jgi:hypothetical protein
MTKRRHYVCESGFDRKRDADAEAAIIRRIGHKATVKRDPAGGYKVCRTMRRKARR